ncbi:MAG: InlB B-repeat-containing protein [Kiritimatiellaeota bacterium]|nr:InlB B-repeat-containing protein [Kiritimatiellota bacterium]
MKKIVWVVMGLLAAVAADAAIINVAGGPGALQAAINGAANGDVLMVAPGTYWPINTQEKRLDIQSTGGASVTFINGGGTNRCAMLSSMYDNILTGFTLTNGNANASGVAYRFYGGGAWGRTSTLNNCVITGNTADYGGGTYACTLNNCVLSGNEAGYYYGGGAYNGSLYDCTLTNNTAGVGGGMYGGVLYDCVLTGNRSLNPGGGAGNCTLTGCTLANNMAALEGGGAYDSVLYDCVLEGNTADWGGGAYYSDLYDCTLSGNEAESGGGAGHCDLYDCTLSGNEAFYGGGAYEGMLTGCTLSGNEAYFGGGAYNGTLTNCVLEGNSARNNGGGANGGTLVNCTLSGNEAGTYGGGTRGCTLDNCTVTGNRAVVGGGAYDGTLNNCVLSGNEALSTGGGAYVCMLNNCTVAGNRAAYEGGGACGFASDVPCTLNNCVVWGNTASSGTTSNYNEYCVFAYSCTSPAPSGSADGGGNVSKNPLFAPMDFRLTEGSPCIDTGANGLAVGFTDVLGNPRFLGGLVDMGAYEGAWAPRLDRRDCPRNVAASRDVAGAVRVSWEAPLAEGAVLYAVCRLDAATGEFAPLSGWMAEGMEFVDTDVVRGTDYTYAVVAAFDAKAADTSALSAPATGWCLPSVIYVDAGQTNNYPNGLTWETAWNDLRSAVNTSRIHDTIVVTNGTYMPIQPLDRRITIESVEGAGKTFIDGEGEYRCASLGGTTSGQTNTVLIGFTLMNGGAGGAQGGILIDCTLSNNVASQGGGANNSVLIGCTVVGNKATYNIGGGAYNCTLINCTLTGNEAASHGGGTYGGTLVNCTLEGNVATNWGGGACAATLNNCLLTGNKGDLGGGVNGCTLTNCTLTGNSAASYGGGAYSGTLVNCTLEGNEAGSNGGGAHLATLNNCLLTGNKAIGGYGGGAYQGTLVNCTVAGNQSNGNGGGVMSSTVRNSIVWGNLRGAATDNYYAALGSFTNSCTSPLAAGDGNIGEDPLFADAAGGDFRLREGSPCVSAGNNDFAVGAFDLDGNPRIMGATVNMGAYESIGFDEALGFPGLVWRTGGAAAWFAQSAVTHGGEYALQSGAIGISTNTWIETTLENPGSLTFWWKVSSESMGGHVLTVFTNGAEAMKISREVDWEPQTLDIAAGTVVRWEYAKNRAAAEGADCGWLDEVQWRPTYTVTFDADGGTPPIQTKVVTKGDVYGSLPDAAREGYDLVGWFNGDGMKVVSNTVVTAIAPHTLTARWAVNLGGAVNAPQLVWQTGGDADWFVQSDVSNGDGYAAQSGAIENYQSSWIETSVTGEGTLSFWWKVSSEAGYDFLICTTNGAEAMRITGEDGWKQETLNLTASETTIRWSFVKDEIDLDDIGEDCGWLDEVMWVPASVGDPALLSYAAWRVYYGNLPDTTDNYNLWLAGLIPGDPTSKFRIHTFKVEGDAVTDLQWTPDLRPHRVYTVLGKTNLMDNAWGVTNNATHFFKVRVALP